MADLSTTSPKPETTFLSLPAELRNAIYLYSLSTDDHQQIIDASRLESTDYVSHRPPAVSAVHSQVRREFQSLYYSTRMLKFRLVRGSNNLRDPERTYLNIACDWLRIFGPEALPHLREFQIIVDFSPFAGSLYLATGDEPVNQMQRQVRTLAILVPQSRKAANVWIYGTGDLWIHTSHFAELLGRRLEGREKAGLEMEDFEDLVCEIGRLRKWTHSQWELFSEAKRRQIYDADVFDTLHPRDFRFDVSVFFLL